MGSQVLTLLDFMLVKNFLVDRLVDENGCEDGGSDGEDTRDKHDLGIRLESNTYDSFSIFDSRQSLETIGADCRAHFSKRRSESIHRGSDVNGEDGRSHEEGRRSRSQIGEEEGEAVAKPSNCGG